MNTGGGGAVIDLRSDTVTKPTPAMRRAMAAAEVGDDQYGEDPTVRRLEEAAAARFDREAALYCPTGIMCNQIWLRLLVPAGTEALVEAKAHIVNYEGGAAAVLSGVQLRTVAGERGMLPPDVVAAAIRPDHFPQIPTSAVCVEQTANRGGGAVYPLGWLEEIRSLADAAGASVYMDGARVFNAAVAAGVDPAAYAGLADGLMFCVSKGLGAPVGSLMVGDAAHIDEARLWRRRYGGAMRQAGVIAAAGLVALDEMVDRLAADHVNARLLAEAAAEAYPAGVDLDQVETNIVFIENCDAQRVLGALRERGILAASMDPRTVRLTTHAGVTDEDCRRAADAVRAALTADMSAAPVSE